MELKLPSFNLDSEARNRIEQEQRTAKLIQQIWNAASKMERRDIRFLCLLTTLGWININRDRVYADSTSKWRNRKIAEYLKVTDTDDLATTAAKRWPSVSVQIWGKLFLEQNHTGITHYYRAQREKALKHIEINNSNIYGIYLCATSKVTAERKLKKIFLLLEKIPPFKTPRGGDAKMLNAISPTLACLDPKAEIPIINQRTEPLLGAIGREVGLDGALALHTLIGKKGISDSFALDVYADSVELGQSSLMRRGAKIGKKRKQRSASFKEEQKSIVVLNRKRITIQKRHNKMTNNFIDLVQWQYGRPSEEYYDLLMKNWKPNIDLMIEVKTAAEGGGGRLQIRTAIGQLFDYGLSYEKETRRKVKLAILLPKCPPEDLMELLNNLDIGVIWFSGKKLAGTVKFREL